MEVPLYNNPCQMPPINIEVNGYTYRGSNSNIFASVSVGVNS